LPNQFRGEGPREVKPAASEPAITAPLAVCALLAGPPSSTGALARWLETIAVVVFVKGVVEIVLIMRLWPQGPSSTVLN